MTKLKRKFDIMERENGMENENYMLKTKGGEEMNELNPFDAYKAEIDAAVGKILKKIEDEKTERTFVKSDDYPLQRIYNIINEITEAELGVQIIKPGETELEPPPAHISADFSISTFRLAKKMGEKPSVIAEKISASINKSKNRLVKSAESIGPFVNIELWSENLYPEIISSTHSLGDKYGESDVNSAKVALLDYSAPNIAKPIGVGHLRSTIIGQALANIYRATGYTEIRINHLGDWGTQFGKLIYAYEHWADKGKISENPLDELKNLYIKFHQEAEAQPEIENEARLLFKKLEEKDPKLVELWKEFRDLSIDGFQNIYDKLGIKFDTYMGEGYFSDQAKDATKECLDNGVARKDHDTEAVVVDSLDGVPSFLLQKQDGSSLYLTRDLATLASRIKIFKPETILYVVGSEQELHFKQLFLLSQKIGLLKSDTRAKHIEFGMILSEGKKMSTRKGTLIELDDLINQSITKSKEIIIQKNPSFPPETVDQIAEIIGIGAILYNDLKQSRTTNISFDWKKMLNFEGGSAVYLQYTCVRIRSILKKIEGEYNEETDLDSSFLAKFEKPIEFQISKKLMLFSSVILQSQRLDSPHLLCEYLEELARLFNNLYAEISISGTTEINLRQSRIMLITAVKNVIQKGLSLLNINVPEQM